MCTVRSGENLVWSCYFIVLRTVGSQSHRRSLYNGDSGEWSTLTAVHHCSTLGTYGYSIVQFCCTTPSVHGISVRTSRRAPKESGGSTVYPVRFWLDYKEIQGVRRIQERIWRTSDIVPQWYCATGMRRNTFCFSPMHPIHSGLWSLLMFPWKTFPFPTMINFTSCWRLIWRFGTAQQGRLAIEKETYAVLASVDCMHRIAACPAGFDIYTDHENLVFLYDHFSIVPDLSQISIRKVLSWVVCFSLYKYTFVHIKETDNMWADLLGRWSALFIARRSVRILELPSSSHDYFILPTTEIIH